MEGPSASRQPCASPRPGTRFACSSASRSRRPRVQLRGGAGDLARAVLPPPVQVGQERHPRHRGDGSWPAPGVAPAGHDRAGRRGPVPAGLARVAAPLPADLDLRPPPDGGGPRAAPGDADRAPPGERRGGSLDGARVRRVRARGRLATAAPGEVRQPVPPGVDGVAVGAPPRPDLGARLPPAGVPPAVRGARRGDGLGRRRHRPRLRRPLDPARRGRGHRDRRDRRPGARARVRPRDLDPAAARDRRASRGSRPPSGRPPAPCRSRRSA